jgi:hypothetical protein
MRTTHKTDVLEQLQKGNLSEEVTSIIEHEANGVAAQYKN